MPRYSQHFLINHHAIESIVSAVAPTQEDVILEIGPGKGALTGSLVESGARVIAVEIDPVWAEELKSRFVGKENFSVINQDILEFKGEGIGGQVKIVGNLPYNITSPILERLCEWTFWNEAVLMVQKEVANRLIASPGGKDFGAISVGVSLFCETERVFDLSPGSFDPPPKVFSTVVRLRRRKEPLTQEPQAVRRVVQAAFQQRRKTLLNSLSHGLGLEKEVVRKLLTDHKISTSERPERLSVMDFVKLGLAVKKL